MEEVLPQIESESVDVILTDPPYLYLKNQKLDKQFDEELFFREAKRVLKKNGFIVLFGRGTSFYRWNTMLSNMGFTFKEEIIWDKSYNTSPLMAISRVHETISIHVKGNTKINKVKVPYLEMKGHDPKSVMQDVKRMSSILKNPKSLNAVEEYLKNNFIYNDRKKALSTTISGGVVKNMDRSAAVLQIMDGGMNEKSIIRTDFTKTRTPKLPTSTDGTRAKEGAKVVTVMNSIEQGMNEKTIIKAIRDHYSAIHPTQKPVRLIERLLALVRPKDIERPVVLDPFAGSFSTGEAGINMGFFPILIELDEEYYKKGLERIEEHQR